MLTTLLIVLLLTALIEAVTCWCRFGLDLQSTRDTAWLARFTLGLRVHHGYVGAAMMLVCPLIPAGPIYTLMLAGGAAMVISDLIHHYCVLWPITGRPEFHVVYPDSRLARWRDGRVLRRSR